jgi:outer membrane biosynthesis protein TonB
MIQTRLFGDFHGKDQSRRRFWIGMWLSLGLHAFVLSRQFGVPGLGLPGLGQSRSERPSQNTDVQVTLALPAPGMTGVTGSAPLSLPAMPAPPSPPVSGNAPLESRVNPPMPAASSRLQLVDPRPTAPVPPVPSRAPAPGKKAKGTKAGNKPKSRIAAKPASKRRQTPPVIAKSSDGDSRFNMLAPSPEQQGEQADTFGLAEQAAVDQEERTAGLAMAELEPVEQNVETGNEGETQREVQREVQPELQPRTEEAIALQRQQEEREALVQAEREMAKQHEERHRQTEARQAAQLAAAQETQQRQQLQQQQQQEQEQLAGEDALRRQQEAAQQESQQAARLTEAQREEERRRQEEMRIARQRQEDYLAQAEKLARQQAEEARVRAEEQAARQKMQAEAEAETKSRADAQARAQAQAAAARQREQDRIALNQRDDGLSGSDNRRNEAPGAAGDLSRSLPGAGDLASRALELARRPDLPRLESQASRPAPESADPSLRRSILGNAPQDVGLAMYVEGWRLKIERTGRLNYTQSAVDRSLVDAIVTVIIRSDGSVEEILFNRSSGRPELDEAIRRIIRINAKYASFPPDLARRFDVIEIRRIWNFGDNKLKVMEEVKF